MSQEYLELANGDRIRLGPPIPYTFWDTICDIIKNETIHFIFVLVVLVVLYMLACSNRTPYKYRINANLFKRITLIANSVLFVSSVLLFSEHYSESTVAIFLIFCAFLNSWSITQNDQKASLINWVLYSTNITMILLVLKNNVDFYGFSTVVFFVGALNILYNYAAEFSSAKKE